MARLLPLLLFLVGVLIVAIVRQMSLRPRSDHVYRPRAKPWSFGGPGSGRPGDTGRGTNWVARRVELEGVRDAYSSAALDPDAPLWRCGGCQAYYQRASVDALGLDNGGRCALCRSDDLRPVTVV